MKAFLRVFFVLIVLSGCRKDNSSHTPNTVQNPVTVTTDTSDTLTYLALGDSYTYGVGVSVQQSYAFQLTSLLNDDSLIVSPPVIVAQQGWTTQQLINNLSSNPYGSKTYSFVTLSIGVNDQNQGVSETTYGQNFSKLLSIAINLANNKASHVFVMSIPDWGVSPFANGQDNTIGPQIDDFNAINQSESKAMGVHYLNITDLTRQTAGNISFYASDGLHFSAKEYALWITLLAPPVEAQLKKQ